MIYYLDFIKNKIFHRTNFGYYLKEFYDFNDDLVSAIFLKDNILYTYDNNPIKSFNFDDIVYIPIDLYQKLCINDFYEFKQIDKLLKWIDQQCFLVGGSKFLEDVGKKTYVLQKKLQKFMIPTLVYPNDITKINELSKGDYVIKIGLSSASSGVFIENNKNGNQLIDVIKSHNFTLLSLLRQKTVALNCKDNIYIIQPKLDLFEKCYEYKFYITDKIIGLGFSEEYSFRNFKGTPKLNKYIYNYIYDIIKVLKKIYPYYDTARIDLIIECDSNEFAIFDKNWKGKIYLNEIEPLAETTKENAFYIDDTIVNTNISSITPQMITDQIIQNIDVKYNKYLKVFSNVKDIKKTSKCFNEIAIKYDKNVRELIDIYN